MTSAAAAPRPALDPSTMLERYGGRIYALGLRLCGNRADAEDLVQETFLRAVRKADQFEGRSDPGTWLYTIAVRACRRMKRRRGGRGAMPSLDALMPAGAGELADTSELGASGPAGVSLRREATEAIEAQIARLPDVYRLPLVLKDIAELPVEEVASVLGLQEGTVKTRVHRARLLLRKALDAALPTQRVGPVVYDKRVCMDLLAAKQAALDRGGAFSLDDVVCERCRVVFGGLDATRSVCRELSAGKLPASVKAEVLRAARVIARPVTRGRPRRK